MSKSLKILKKYGYIVRVDKIGEVQYKVTYPPYNIYEQKFDEFFKEYSFEQNGIKLDGELLELPLYLRRVAILADIYSQCGFVHIDRSLICFFDIDGKEVKDFFELTGEMLSEEELTREQSIHKMLVGQVEGVSEKDQLTNFRSWKMMKGLSL